MKSEYLQLKLHDYILYSTAAVLYFIIYLDLRRSDKKPRKQRGDNIKKTFGKLLY